MEQFFLGDFNFGVKENEINYSTEFAKSLEEEFFALFDLNLTTRPESFTHDDNIMVPVEMFSQKRVESTTFLKPICVPFSDPGIIL